jgi:drug/metabolite transporter (DMT)-like permease
VKAARAAPRRAVSPHLLLSLASLLWAGNAVVGRGIRMDLPPATFAFWRWVVGLAVLAAFALPHCVQQWQTMRAAWRPLVVLGLFGTAIHNALQYKGLQQTTATNGLLLNACVPIIVIVFSRMFLGQRLTWIQDFGVALSLAGVIAIVTRADFNVLATLSVNAGDLWVLIGISCWAVYTLCLRWRPPMLHPLAFLLAIGCVGLAAITPFYLAELALGQRMNLSPAALSAIAYAALGPSVLAFVCWNQGVRQIGPSKASLFLHLMPVFGTLLSMIFLGEQLQLYHVIGVALIFSGIYLTTKARAGASQPA